MAEGHACTWNQPTIPLQRVDEYCVGLEIGLGRINHCNIAKPTI